MRKTNSSSATASGSIKKEPKLASMEDVGYAPASAYAASLIDSKYSKPTTTPAIARAPTPAIASAPVKVKLEGKDKYAPVIVPKSEAEEINSSDDETEKAKPKEQPVVDETLDLVTQMQRMNMGTVIKSQKKKEGNIKFAVKNMFENAMGTVQKHVNRAPHDLLLMPLDKIEPFSIANITMVDTKLDKHDKFDEERNRKHGLMPDRPLAIQVYHFDEDITKVSNGKIKMMHTLCVEFDAWRMLFPLRKGIDWINTIFAMDAFKHANRYIWKARTEVDGEVRTYVSFSLFLVGAFGTFDFSASAGSIAKVAGKDDINENPRNTMIHIGCAITNYMVRAQRILYDRDMKRVVPPPLEDDSAQLRAERDTAIAERDAERAETARLRQEMAIMRAREAKHAPIVAKYGRIVPECVNICRSTQTAMADPKTHKVTIETLKSLLQYSPNIVAAATEHVAADKK
jgi:hypothetical protein